MGNQTVGNVAAILMVGGGIAGMQTGLDTAAAGFEVRLVERDISIGGLMVRDPIPICTEEAVQNSPG